MAYLPGKFVWFEHVSGDVARARAFYEALFGWSTQSMPMGDRHYDIISNGEQGIGGYRPADKGTHAHWASYLSVPDVDKAFKTALAAGAKALTEPVDFGSVGRGAQVSDPAGARVSLWKGASDDPADVQTPPVGAWFWNELHSSDAKAAVDFYTRVFGYSHDAMDMGPGGTYHILKDAAGVMRGGIVQQEAGMTTPSNWLPYVHVADCDAATNKAMQLGAMATVAGPMDIPDIGRFSIVLDPLGAPFGMITGAA